MRFPFGREQDMQRKINMNYKLTTQDLCSPIGLSNSSNEIMLARTSKCGMAAIYILLRHSTPQQEK